MEVDGRVEDALTSFRKRISRSNLKVTISLFFFRVDYSSWPIKLGLCLGG